MYYFIIPVKNFYQILRKLHFEKCVLHFKMYYCSKCTNFALDNTKRKRIGLFFEYLVRVCYTLFIINILIFNFYSFTI